MRSAARLYAFSVGVAIAFLLLGLPAQGAGYGQSTVSGKVVALGTGTAHIPLEDGGYRTEKFPTITIKADRSEEGGRGSAGAFGRIRRGDDEAALADRLERPEIYQIDETCRVFLATRSGEPRDLVDRSAIRVGDKIFATVAGKVVYEISIAR